MPDVKEASDLARFTEATWKSLIQTQGVGVPPDTPGASADEKTQNYARQIARQVEAAFPTRVVAERLGASPVATFLKNQPSYNLNTYPEDFFKKNPAAAQGLTSQDRDQLRNVQRMYRVTGRAEEAIALAQKKEVRSAYKIARTDGTVFAQQNREIFSADRAHEVHERARRTSAIALALLGEHGAGLNRTALRVLPKLDTEEERTKALRIPDWETLFGGADFCACQECSAAHGPAAYFVDVLKFLSERRLTTAPTECQRCALRPPPISATSS